MFPETCEWSTGSWQYPFSEATRLISSRLCVLCVLCVVALFPVVEGPCKRYAMTRHVCQVPTASRGRRRSVSPEGDHMAGAHPDESNRPRHYHGGSWICVHSGAGQQHGLEPAQLHHSDACQECGAHVWRHIILHQADHSWPPDINDTVN